MTAWLALLDAPMGDLSAAAVGIGGERVLAAWLDSDARPHPEARRLDPEVLDAAGPPADVSLVWPALHALPLFDDPAVVRARRVARRLPSPRCVSTFTVDAQHFAGSLWVPGDRGRLDDDPFRLLGVPLQLSVVAGLIGSGPYFVGPAQERYAGAPWPSGSFPAVAPVRAHVGDEPTVGHHRGRLARSAAITSGPNSSGGRPARGIPVSRWSSPASAERRDDPNDPQRV